MSDLDDIGYVKTIMSTYIRTSHAIIFKEGMNAFSLKKMLQNVPAEAIIEDVDNEYDDNLIRIQFGEEKESGG